MYVELVRTPTIVVAGVDDYTDIPLITSRDHLYEFDIVRNTFFHEKAMARCNMDNVSVPRSVRMI